MKAILVWLTRVTTKCVFVGICICVLCASQTGTAQSRDFGQGFAKFYALGLPHVKGAEYVNLSIHDNVPGLNLHDLYEASLSGNAWLLKDEPENGARKFVVDSTRTIEVYEHSVLEKEREARIKQESGKDVKKRSAAWLRIRREDHRTGGRWKGVDVDGDLKKLLKFLEKKKEDAEKNNHFYFHEYGTVFLRAAHYYEQGYTNEANQIVQTLFDMSGDPRKVIMAGLNEMADSQYLQAYSDFVRTKDWTAYLKNINELLARFPAGWRQRPVVELLGRNVAEHIELDGIPEITGEDLTEDDKALARELAEFDGVGETFGYGGELWILPESRRQRRFFGGSQENGVMAKIRKRGMKSVPMLIALLDDRYFVTGDLSGGGYHWSSYSSDGLMTEEQLKRMYNSLSRPLTRGDIARRMLSKLLVLGDDYRYGNRLPDAEFKEECVLWYRNNKDKSVVELARMYLDEGSDEQAHAAMQSLVSGGNTNDLEAVEQYLLESVSDSDRSYGGMDVVREYVLMRGDEAKPFLEKYIESLKKSVESIDREMYGGDDFKKHIDGQVKALENLLSAKPLDQMLNDLASGNMTWQEAEYVLPQRLAREKKDKALTLVLEAAGNADVPETAGILLGVAGHIDRMGRHMMDVVLPAEDSEDEEEQIDIATHTELWKKLLADQRPIEAYGSVAGRLTVGDSAAYAIEYLYGDDDLVQEIHALSVMGERGTTLVRDRAFARLEGREPRELPSAENVDEAGLAEIISALNKADDEERAARVKQLSLDELMALAEAVEDEEGKQMDTKLSAIANTITSVSVDTNVTAGIDIQAWQGKELSEGMFTNLFDLCRELAVGDAMIVCGVERTAYLGGVHVFVREITRKQLAAYGMPDTGAEKGGIFAYIWGGGAHASASWPVSGEGVAVEPEKVKKDDKPKSDDALLFDEMEDEMIEEEDDWETEQRREFWKRVAEMCSGEMGSCGYINAGFRGIPRWSDESRDESGVAGVARNVPVAAPAE